MEDFWNYVFLLCIFFSFILLGKRGYDNVKNENLFQSKPIFYEERVSFGEHRSIVVIHKKGCHEAPLQFIDDIDLDNFSLMLYYEFCRFCIKAKDAEMLNNIGRIENKRLFDSFNEDMVEDLARRGYTLNNIDYNADCSFNGQTGNVEYYYDSDVVKDYYNKVYSKHKQYNR